MHLYNFPYHHCQGHFWTQCAADYIFQRWPHMIICNKTWPFPHQDAESISPLPWIWVTPVTALTEYSGNDAEPVPGLALNRPGSLTGLKSEMTCEETAEEPWSTRASDMWMKKPYWKWMVQPQPSSCRNMDEMNLPAKTFSHSWPTNHEQNKMVGLSH